MTDATLTALITAIPGTFVALGALVSALRTGKKVDQVHALVNSQYTALLEQRLVLLERLVGLEPSTANIKAAEVGKQAVEDHKATP